MAGRRELAVQRRWIPDVDGREGNNPRRHLRRESAPGGCRGGQGGEGDAGAGEVRAHQRRVRRADRRHQERYAARVEHRRARWPAHRDDRARQPRGARRTRHRPEPDDRRAADQRDQRGMDHAKIPFGILVLMRVISRALALLVLASAAPPLAAQLPPAPSRNVQGPPAQLVPDAALLLAERGSEMRGVVERYSADRNVLLRRYAQQYSASQRDVLVKFYDAWTAQLKGIDFNRLSLDAKADHVLLRNSIEEAQEELARDAKVYADLAGLLPFADSIFALEDARRRMENVDGARSAQTLSFITSNANALRTKIESPPKGDSSAAKTSKVAAYRAAVVTAALRNTLKSWFQFYNGYDPLFSWWTGAPYRSADSALTNYQKVLREKIVGWKKGDDEPIVGLPIGRTAIETSIRHEMLPYSPEELIAIAEKELAWGESEMKKASREMGFGDDWKKAMEKVKLSYVPPGEQVNMVRCLLYTSPSPRD